VSWGQGRLDALLGVLEDLAAGEFEARAPLSDARDDLDAIALGVNALAEEVQVARGEAERHRLRLQRILDMSPSTIYACEATEPFGATFISQAVVGQFGFDPGAFLADPGFWASRIHPEDAPRIFEGLGELFEHGDHAHEYRWQRADGTWAWVHDQLALVYGDDGQPLEIVGTWIDITERKRGERELAASEERLQATFAALPDVVLRLHIDGTILDFHANRQSLAVMPSEGIVGAALGDVLPLAVADIVQRGIRAAAADPGRLQNIEFELRLDRPRTFEGRLIAAGDSEVVAIVRDVTDWRAQEASLKLAREQAEAADRAKSEFLANMSHEVRTPMNGVLGMLHLTLQTGLTEKQRDYLEKTDKAARSLLRILDDILDFSKIQAGKLSVEQIPFTLDEVLADLSSLARTADSRIDVRMTVAPGVPRRLLGDPLRLGQILTNLMSNAIKFTHEGSVVLSVDVQERRGAEAILLFSVRDTGIGMTVEQRRGSFQAFAQADASTTRHFGGTGLGLVISRKLAALLGGTLEVESELGVGSTFSFTAVFQTSEERETDPPAWDRGSERSSARGAVFEEAQRKLAGVRVLLAEDNELNQQVARALLERWGLVVEVAWTGVEAVSKAQTGDYDVVLMDIQMPQMDGLEAARRIRALAATRPELKELPILAMTAHAMPSERELSLAAGMNGHLTKPIDPTALIDSLVRWAAPSERNMDERAQPDAPAGAVPDQLDLPGFDVAGSLRRLGGNRALYLRLLGMFRDDYAEIADRVEAAAAAGDLEAVREMAHTVRGVAGNFGAAELEAGAADLERASMSEAPEPLGDAVRAFRRAFDEAFRGLAGLPPAEASGASAVGRSEPASR